MSYSLSEGQRCPMNSEAVSRRALILTLSNEGRDRSAPAPHVHRHINLAVAINFFYVVLMFLGIELIIEPFENPLDTRKLESSSYHALGACLRSYNVYFLETIGGVDRCSDSCSNCCNLSMKSSLDKCEEINENSRCFVFGPQEVSPDVARAMRQIGDAEAILFTGLAACQVSSNSQFRRFHRIRNSRLHQISSISSVTGFAVQVETILTMSPENKAHYESKKEAIHLLLTGIGDEIYSTVDVCKTAHEIWIAIERLKQESMESYYSRFYKMMNGLIRNNLTVATMQVNVNFLQQLQPEWLRSNASTKFKGKEIAKPITSPSESAFEEDSDPEQAQKDKDMQKNLALIAKYFKKLYKPTNNNLKTSSNSRNKNVDTSRRYKNDNQTGQFGNQRTVTVAKARETVGSQETKRVKDYTYHKEKMSLCKQAEKGVPLQAEQADWLEDTNEEIDKQELEAHYGFMEKIQEVLPPESNSTAEPLEQVQYDYEYNVFTNERQHSEQPESISNTCVVEKVNSNVIPDSLDMCDNDIQTDQNAEKEHVALANLIANLKHDVDENKKIQNQLKKANTSLAHELKECKSILAETSRV
ncbi:hypothetical protein Tco_0370255 [Tanacetum coccineum]